MKDKPDPVTIEDIFEQYSKLLKKIKGVKYYFIPIRSPNYLTKLSVRKDKNVQ